MSQPDRYEASVVKLDAARLRTLGKMLATDTPEFREPRNVLYDLANKNAKDLLAKFNETRSSFVTSPFDPEGNKIRFYLKGYTIWSGYPGSGKTTALRQLICHLLHAKQKVFVASMEEDPVDVIVQLAGVCFGREIPSEHQLQWFIDYYAESLIVWGVTGIARHREIFGTVQKLAKERGVTQVVIDSLTCLDINSQDFEQHRQFANILNAVSIESNIHTHLVAHPRKAVSVNQEPDQNDVAGGADYARLAHNIIFIRRGAVNGSDFSMIPMQVAIRKQRYGSGFIGDINGVFNRRVRQFKLDQYDQIPTQYMPKQAYEDAT
jgi:KaiC/GvpD/RAD55 family RecA-like ATPase